MIKSLLLVVCATLMIVSSVSADSPTPPCYPGCAVSIVGR